MAHSEPKAVTAVPETTYSGHCDKHGDFIGKALESPFGGTILRMGCPSCSAERKAQEGARQAHLEASKRAEAERKDLQAKRSAGVPARFDSKTLESFRVTNDGQRRALEACQTVVSRILEGKQAPNLVLQGKPGTGKTHLSCGMTSALYRTHRVRRIDLPDLIREIRATWQKGAEHTEKQVLDWFGSIDLLILEEVGTGSGSDDERARVFQVINRRYEAMLPTVVVTNLTLRELRDEMGERVLDRLREGDRSVLVFDWESMRGEA